MDCVRPWGTGLMAWGKFVDIAQNRIVPSTTRHVKFSIEKLFGPEGAPQHVDETQHDNTVSLSCFHPPRPSPIP